jgi:hypothetical protein
MNNMNVNSLFKKQSFEPGTEKFLEFDALKVGIKREKEGWYILAFENDTADRNENKKPDLNTGEYYQSGKSNSLVTSPSLPSKPLVFKGANLFVTPKQKLTFFVALPLNLQLYYSRIHPENLMKEIAPIRMSDTWFGEPVTGEAAFALGNAFALNQEKLKASVLQAICPIQIFNNSTLVLEIERLIIRTDNLALYVNSGKIYTSLVEIEYKGKDIISSAEYHYSRTYHGEKPEILVKPRNTGGILKKNFHFIRSIYRSEL